MGCWGSRVAVDGRTTAVKEPEAPSEHARTGNARGAGAPHTGPPAPGRSGARPRATRLLLARLGDEQLARRVRRGDERAFEILFERHLPGLLAFCRHLTGTREDAEDAVQHAFAAAYRELRSGSERQLALKPWLYAVARNRCISILRERRPNMVSAETDEPRADDDTAAQREDVRELLADLRQLPHDQRAALLLFEVADMSQREIAQALGVEVGRVKGLVFRARSTLLKMREARERPCAEVREEIAMLRGGSLRRSSIALHLRSCAGCREFKERVAKQRTLVSLALPVAITPALKASLASAVVGGTSGKLGGVAAAGGSAAGAGATAGAGAVAGSAPIAGSAPVAGSVAVAGSAPIAGSAAVAGVSAGGAAAAAAKVLVAVALVGGGAIGGKAAVDRVTQPTHPANAGASHSAAERTGGSRLPATAPGGTGSERPHAQGARERSHRQRSEKASGHARRDNASRDDRRSPERGQRSVAERRPASGKAAKAQSKAQRRQAKSNRRARSTVPRKRVFGGPKRTRSRSTSPPPTTGGASGSGGGGKASGSPGGSAAGTTPPSSPPEAPPSAPSGRSSGSKTKLGSDGSGGTLAGNDGPER